MEKTNQRFDSRALYYYGRELLSHGEYAKAREILETFLERPDGWRENQIDAARQIAYCWYGLGQKEKALHSFFRSFTYDAPRGEVCCDIGRYFMDRQQYQTAAYWQEQALCAEKKMKTGACVEEECYGYLPAILLCVCYDRMGQYRKAWEMNELAGKYRPESEHYLLNRAYFRKISGEKQAKSEL